MVIEANIKEPVNNITNEDLSTVSSSYPDSPASYSDAEGAIKLWESSTNTLLSKGLKKIAREAYNIHIKEDRGLVR